MGSYPQLKMIKTLLVCFLVCSLAFASPVPAEDNEAGEMANRGLIEDLLIGMIRDLVINQINAIWGSRPPPPLAQDWLEAAFSVLLQNRNYKQFNVLKLRKSCFHVYNNFSSKFE